MTAEQIKDAKLALNLASAIFGMIGTWLMSKRYAREFTSSILFAFIAPILYCLGQGKRVRDFFRSLIHGNSNLPESESEMAAGLAILFWAFLLQVGSAFLDRMG